VCLQKYGAEPHRNPLCHAQCMRSHKTTARICNSISPPCAVLLSIYLALTSSVSARCRPSTSKLCLHLHFNNSICTPRTAYSRCGRAPLLRKPHNRVGLQRANIRCPGSTAISPLCMIIPSNILHPSHSSLYL